MSLLGLPISSPASIRKSTSRKSPRQPLLGYSPGSPRRLREIVSSKVGDAWVKAIADAKALSLKCQTGPGSVRHAETNTELPSPGTLANAAHERLLTAIDDLEALVESWPSADNSVEEVDIDWLDYRVESPVSEYEESDDDTHSGYGSYVDTPAPTIVVTPSPILYKVTTHQGYGATSSARSMTEPLLPLSLWSPYSVPHSPIMATRSSGNLSFSSRNISFGHSPSCSHRNAIGLGLPACNRSLPVPVPVSPSVLTSPSAGHFSPPPIPKRAPLLASTSTTDLQAPMTSFSSSPSPSVNGTGSQSPTLGVNAYGVEVIRDAQEAFTPSMNSNVRIHLSPQRMGLHSNRKRGGTDPGDTRAEKERDVALGYRKPRKAKSMSAMVKRIFGER